MIRYCNYAEKQLWRMRYTAVWESDNVASFYLALTKYQGEVRKNAVHATQMISLWRRNKQPINETYLHGVHFSNGWMQVFFLWISFNPPKNGNSPGRQIRRRVLEYKKVWLCVSHPASVLTGSHRLSLLMKKSRRASVGNLTKQTHKQHRLWCVWQYRWCCSLSNQPPHHSGPREGPAVLVGHRPIDIALEEGEHWEPDASSTTLLVGPGVSQGVVV